MSDGNGITLTVEEIWARIEMFNRQFGESTLEVYGLPTEFLRSGSSLIKSDKVWTEIENQFRDFQNLYPDEFLELKNLSKIDEVMSNLKADNSGNVDLTNLLDLLNGPDNDAIVRWMADLFVKKGDDLMAVRREELRQEMPSAGPGEINLDPIAEMRKAIQNNPFGYFEFLLGIYRNYPETGTGAGSTSQQGSEGSFNLPQSETGYASIYNVPFTHWQTGFDAPAYVDSQAFYNTAVPASYIQYQYFQGIASMPGSDLARIFMQSLAGMDVTQVQTALTHIQKIVNVLELAVGNTEWISTVNNLVSKMIAGGVISADTGDNLLRIIKEYMSEREILSGLNTGVDDSVHASVSSGGVSLPSIWPVSQTVLATPSAVQMSGLPAGTDGASLPSFVPPVAALGMSGGEAGSQSFMLDIYDPGISSMFEVPQASEVAPIETSITGQHHIPTPSPSISQSNRTAPDINQNINHIVRMVVNRYQTVNKEQMRREIVNFLSRHSNTRQGSNQYV